MIIESIAALSLSITICKVIQPTYIHTSDRELTLTSKSIAFLPKDIDASCDHPDISVKFHVSPRGDVFNVRLFDPSRDYLYYNSIVESFERWHYRPKIENLWAQTTRNVEYTFKLKEDFYECNRRNR